MFETWNWTVRREVNVRAAISGLDMPSDTNTAIFCSVGVSAVQPVFGRPRPFRGGVVVGDAQQLRGIGVDQGARERCGPTHRGACSIAHIAVQHGDRFTRSRGVAVRYAERDQTGQQVVPAELTLACDALGPGGRPWPYSSLPATA
jgi:hypothetical protein